MVLMTWTFYMQLQYNWTLPIIYLDRYRTYKKYKYHFLKAVKYIQVNEL